MPRSRLRETIGTVHEFSIAEALAAQVRRNAPPGAIVREVEIRVGPLRGLDPDAMAMCWDAVTHDTPLAGAVLRIDSIPWTITCPGCGRTWSESVPFVECPCGEPNAVPSGGDELDLIALVVDEIEAVEEAVAP